MHHYDPVDECSYRRRAIYAFTLKPIFMLILVTIALVVRYGAAVIASLWLIMAKLTVFILGWRPEPIFKDFGRIWNIKTESPCEIDWDITTGDNYGVWDYQKGQFYPVTGGAIILSTLAISMLLVLCATLSEILCNAELKHELAPWAFSAILLGVLTLIAFWALSSWTKLQWIRTCRDACKAWYVKKWPKKSPQITPVPVKVEEKKELLKPTYYFEWLKSSLNADQLPKRVDLAKVPTAFKQPTIHKFRLSFNAMKAKVCKPFPRH